MTDFDRPPASSRDSAPRYENSLTATLNSADMKNLLEQCVKEARSSFKIPLIVKHEEGRELASFTRRALTRIGGQEMPLEIVTPDNGLPNNSFGDCGMLILGAHLMGDDVLAQFDAEHFDYPAVRITIFAFPNEKAYKETRGRFPTNYQKSISMHPMRWPKLGARKADLGGIISSVWEAVRPEDDKPDLSRDARDMLLHKPGETVDQLYANLRKAVRFAKKVGSPSVYASHVEADTRKDIRASLHDGVPDRRLTPSSGFPAPT